MKVYKYRSLNKNNIKSLDENYFWASSKDMLNDPHEGKYSTELVDAFFEHYSSLDKNHSLKNLRTSFDTLQEKIKNCGIFSLSKSFSISPLWAHYSDNHKGICIEYNLEELIAKNRGYYQKFHIDYLKNPLDLSIDDVTSEEIFRKIIGTKELCWEYEDEYRVISDIEGKNYHRSDAIISIIFALYTPDNDKKELMLTLANRNIQFRQLYKDKNGYSLLAIDIDNPFDITKSNAGKLRIPDHVIPDEKYIKNEYRDFIPYFYKVAEYMFSYSDCIEFFDMDFSSKSTPDNPIIYVNFKEKGSVHPFSQKLFMIKEMVL